MSRLIQKFKVDKFENTNYDNTTRVYQDQDHNYYFLDLPNLVFDKILKNSKGDNITFNFELLLNTTQIEYKEQCIMNGIVSGKGDDFIEVSFYGLLFWSRIHGGNADYFKDFQLDSKVLMLVSW